MKRVGGNNVDEVTVTASGGPSDNVIGYGEGEQIRTYVKNATSQVGTAYFDGVNSGVDTGPGDPNRFGWHAQCRPGDPDRRQQRLFRHGKHARRQQHAAACDRLGRPTEDVPELKLQMGRQASLFAARNDMDQSQEDRERQRRHLYQDALPSSRNGKRTSISSAPTTSISAITPPTDRPPTGRSRSPFTTSSWPWAMRSALIPTPIPRTPTS